MINQFEGVDIPLDGQSLLAMAKENSDAEIDIDDGLPGRFESTFAEIVENAPVHAAGRYLLQLQAPIVISHLTLYILVRKPMAPGI